MALQNQRRVSVGVRLASMAVLAASLSACGPIQTIHYVQETQSELEVAKAADAETLAPYEYFSSMAYLEKVREENGYAEFATCVDFGQKALKYAKSAKAKSMEARADGAMPVVHDEEASSTKGADDADDEPRLPGETPSAKASGAGK